MEPKGDVKAWLRRSLLETYPSLGYETIILPKVSVAERVDFILHTLAE